jgi:hypothetical protein
MSPRNEVTHGSRFPGLTIRGSLRSETRTPGASMRVRPSAVVWAVRQLDRQIQSQFYERTALALNKRAMLRKGARSQANDTTTPDEEIKDLSISRTSTSKPNSRTRPGNCVQSSSKSCAAVDIWEPFESPTHQRPHHPHCMILCAAARCIDHLRSFRQRGGCSRRAWLSAGRVRIFTHSGTLTGRRAPIPMGARAGRAVLEP